MTDLADTADFVRARTQPSPWHSTRLWLAVYSVVICGGTFIAFNSHAPTPIMGSRAADVESSIGVLDRGGPPLLASDAPYHQGIALSHLHPAGAGDDQGIFLYLPELSKLTGQKDPATLMKWLFVGCFALLALVYPLMFYELFGSIFVALAAPLLAVWKFGFTESQDLYWILAWCMLLGIPGIVLAYQWWRANRRRAAAVLLVGLMIAASFSTSIRINSGLPILISALGVVLFVGASPWRERQRLLRFWHLPRWWVRPVIAAALVLAYLSIATFGFAAVRAYRNHVIHSSSFGGAWPTQHPFWHNAYIGLGYLPNKYGIAWNDAVSADAVQRARPGTGFLTTEYESTLRHIYLHIARTDPGFVLRNIWTKARVIVADAVSRLWPALILLPLAALAGARRRSIRVALLVALPAWVLGALAPLLTIPDVFYELAWLGTWGALLILAFGSLWVAARDAAAELPADLAPLRERPDRDAYRSLVRRLVNARAAWVTVAAIVLTFTLAAVARPAPEPGASAPPANQSMFTDSSWFDHPAVRSWQFAGALPKGWANVAPAFLERDASGTSRTGLYVLSPVSLQEDLLTGPPVELKAGTYDLLTSAKELVGGFQIAVRTAQGAPIASSLYSSQETWDVQRQALWLRFSLTSPTTVRPVVTSWSGFPDASSFVLWQMNVSPARKH